MNCEKIKELIIKNFDEGISEEEKALMHEHLDKCSSCQIEFKKINKMFTLLNEEKEDLLSSRETYFQGLNPLEVVHKTRKRTFLLQIKPAYSFTFVVIIALMVLVYFVRLNITADNKMMTQNQKTNSFEESFEIDYFDTYLNERYLFSLLDDTTISGNGTNTLDHLLGDFINQAYNYLMMNNDLIPDYSTLSDEDIDELITQLDTKNY